MGVSGADMLSHQGWGSQDKMEAKHVWGTGVYPPSPQVGRPTRGGTSSVPCPLAPRAKDLSQLGPSWRPHESRPARPLTPQMCPKVW